MRNVEKSMPLLLYSQHLVSNNNNHKNKNSSAAITTSLRAKTINSNKLSNRHANINSIKSNSTKVKKFVSILEMDDSDIKHMQLLIRDSVNRKITKRQNTKRLNNKAQKILSKISSSSNLELYSSSTTFNINEGKNTANENPNTSSALSIIQCLAVIILMQVKKENSHVLKKHRGRPANVLGPSIVKKYKIFEDNFDVVTEQQQTVSKTGYFAFPIDTKKPLKKSDKNGYSVFNTKNNAIDSSAWYLSPRKTFTKKERLPRINEIIKFISRIYVVGKMEKDSLIPSLIYLEKFCAEGYKSGNFKITTTNWKTLIFTCLMLSMKMWDDLAITNNDMTHLWDGINLHRINQLERHALEILQYRLNVTPSVYSSYYFKLREIHFASDALAEFYDPYPFLKPIVNRSTEESSDAKKKTKQKLEVRPKSSPLKKRKDPQLANTKTQKNNNNNNTSNNNNNNRNKNNHRNNTKSRKKKGKKLLKPVVKFQQFPIAERATLLHYQQHAPQSPIENSKPISLFGKSLPFHHSNLPRKRFDKSEKL